MVYVPPRMESTNVHSVYTVIASHFDETRYKPWYGVQSFLESLPSNSSILDVGCGNGKYLSIRKDCYMFGCDPCPTFIEIAQMKHPHANLVCANGLSLPYKSKSMDAIITIAVFHHLVSDENRHKFLQELARVVKSGGSVYITVWSTTAMKPSWKSLHMSGDYLVPWHNKYDSKIYDRYYHLYTKEEIVELVSQYFTIQTITMENDNWHLHVKI